jgi:hypothetical protein
MRFLGFDLGVPTPGVEHYPTGSGNRRERTQNDRYYAALRTSTRLALPRQKSPC